MQSDNKYSRLLNRTKQKPGPKQKIIEAIQMDYSELDARFTTAMELINLMPLHRMILSKGMGIYPGDFTHKERGKHGGFSVKQKEKMLELIAAVGLKCVNI